MDRDMATKKLENLFDELADVVGRGAKLEAWVKFTRSEKDAYLKEPEKRREVVRKFLFGMGSVTDLAIVPKRGDRKTRQELEQMVGKIAEKLWVEIVKNSAIPGESETR